MVTILMLQYIVGVSLMRGWALFGFFSLCCVSEAVLVVVLVVGYIKYINILFRKKINALVPRRN